jgi:hypothetical protein
MKTLSPTNNSITVGRALGRYFLEGIREELKSLLKNLSDPAYILPDDYVVGSLIGLDL